jgi:hypothetical protein
MNKQTRERIAVFSGEKNPKACRHKHKLQGTGALFYQSFGLLQCSRCRGWQHIRKVIK